MASDDGTAAWATEQSHGGHQQANTDSAIEHRGAQHQTGYSVSDMADLDPFAPSESSTPIATPSKPVQTLGSTVKTGALLELLPNDSESSEEGGDSPPASPAKRREPAPTTPAKVTVAEGSAAVPKAPLSPTHFITGMFRSSSNQGQGQGASSEAGPSSATSSPKVSLSPGHNRSASVGAQPEKERLKEELLDEKAAEKAAQSEAAYERATSGQGIILQPAAPEQPAISQNPLNAIFGNVLRSTGLSRQGSAQSGSSTPPKQPPPPRLPSKEKEREKEEDKEVVFDFNQFLEQMRSRQADPIAKYLRSFLKEFTRRSPRSSADQVRVISDFLDFIASKMRTCDPWKASLALARHRGQEERGELEFEMSVEAMEKLVMNRVWHLTFTPALERGSPNPNDGTRRTLNDDTERDHVLSQRIRLFSWVEPKHLDLPIASNEPDPALPPLPPPTPSEEVALLSLSDGETSEKGKSREATTGSEASQHGDPKARKKRTKQIESFLMFARKELEKINQYKAPRDKMICILNCCKVIFGLIRYMASSEQGADTFIPLLIYVVLKTNPEHLVSNILYIQRFRNPDKLSGEGGYYLSSLTAAISFIETLDPSSLSNISQEEFEANVEAAIRTLPVDPAETTLRLPKTPIKATPTSRSLSGAPGSSRSTSPMPPTADVDTDSPTAIDQPGLSFPDATKAFFMRGTDSVERIVSKPLNAIGKIFEQLEQTLGGDSPETSPTSGTFPAQRRGYNPAYPSVTSVGGYTGNRPPPLNLAHHQQHVQPPWPSPLGPVTPGPRDHKGYMSDQMSPGAASKAIDHEHEQQRLASLETLQGMFPNLEKEVLEMVLLSSGGDLGSTIESLLEMS